MNDKPKTKWRWRLLRWGLIGLAGVITLIAVVITEENWRGKRDWDNFRRTAEARGERLDLAFVVPPPVPDDQNFFAAPVVAEALKSEHGQNPDAPQPRGTNGVNRMNFNIYRGNSANWPTNGGNWQKGRLTDLKPWQRYFRTFSQSFEGRTNGFPVAAQPQTPAADILLALSCFNPALEELRQASQRPYARLPLDYEKGFGVVGDCLPWLANEKRCAQFLELRILAELEAGQSGPALDDVKLLLRVTDTIRNQPFLISHLVRIAMTAIALQPIYEGLAQHRWNDTQLAALEAALATQDFLADFQLAMRGERTCAIDEFETQRLTREMKSFTEVLGAETIVTNSLRWMPSAYFYQNELAFARMYEQFVLPLADLTNQTISVAAYRAGQKDFQEQSNHFSPYKILARMTFPAVGKSVVRFATVQTDIDLARVACALERYRLAYGEYPETLDALAPQFIVKLPHDIIGGQPLHYRRVDPPSPGSGAASGKFLLYSVGWNETDDGGQVAFRKSGSVDPEKGDWVWKN